MSANYTRGYNQFLKTEKFKDRKISGSVSLVFGPSLNLVASLERHFSKPSRCC